MEKAVIQRTNEDITASWQVVLPASIPKVWERLTTNQGLASWFPELQIGELAPEGHLLFMMTETEHIKMPITAFVHEETVGFEWGADRVDFQLVALEDNQTKLELRERISEVTGHTPRDLAGWTFCLARLKAGLQGGDFSFSETLFDDMYQLYQARLS